MRTRRRWRLIGWLAVLVMLPGCALATLPYPRPLKRLFKSPLFLALHRQSPHQDYVGVLHVHTRYSHDAHGEFEDVVRVANAQQLDYIVVTEHNNLQPRRDGLEGWHGGTLVMVGMELSTDSGHYLAMGVTEEIDRKGKTAQEIIDEVARQGGFGFLAHPVPPKHPWTDWNATGYTGIEVYNVKHDAIEENKARLAVATIVASPKGFYQSIIDRPVRPLRLWDELIARHGRMVGIGSTDAHEFHVGGWRFAPYEVLFLMARTHVLIPASEPLTPEAVFEALRQGHAYVGLELHAEAKGFSMVVTDRGDVLGTMGDDVAYRPGLEISISLPAPAEMTLFRDGQPMATTIDHAWEVPIAGPGSYRIEAMRHNKPWIISNPIYVW